MERWRKTNGEKEERQCEEDGYAEGRNVKSGKHRIGERAKVRGKKHERNGILERRFAKSEATRM